MRIAIKRGWMEALHRNGFPLQISSLPAALFVAGFKPHPVLEEKMDEDPTPDRSQNPLSLEPRMEECMAADPGE